MDKPQVDVLNEFIVNIDSAAMSAILGLSARSFWTGATWSNTVGTSFVTTNIGPFKPIKGLPEDKKIMLKDILQSDGEVDDRMVSKGKAYTLTASYNGAVVENSIKRKHKLRGCGNAQSR